MSKRIVLLATERYCINMNDFYMFFRRSEHEIVAILYERKVAERAYWQDNHFSQAARLSVYDPMDFNAHRFLPWDRASDLLAKLDALSFDYVCMGNGNAEAQKAVVEHLGREQCLFSEYGWLPWNEHFYISRGGCGLESELREYTAEDLRAQPIHSSALESLRMVFNRGKSVPNRSFVYVPLQKDVNDFKFLSSPFDSNEAFLDFVHEVVPGDYEVWVKTHPLYPKEYDLQKYGRFRDISNADYRKDQLYKTMAAMVCINSTSVLEALLFRQRVAAYGDDIFVGKDLVRFRPMDGQCFNEMLGTRQNGDQCDRFISLLLERQVHRSRCVEDGEAYVRGHYWNIHV
ncbi:MAG: hypothetical protein AAF654_04210 [Myxococcota bacterium]